jgi:hypothetical protein
MPRILVSMIILKVRIGRTSSCMKIVGIIWMRALGLTNIDDEVPVPSTKSFMIVEINLIEELFRSLKHTSEI